MAQHATFPGSAQGPLGTGERLFDLSFLDTRGQPLSLYDNRLFGWPKAIHVAPSLEPAAGALARFASLAQEFAQAETHVIVVTAASAEENAALVERLKLPFPVLSDPQRELEKAVGLDGGACTLLFDPVLRLERRITDAVGASQADAALAHAKARFSVLRPFIVAAQAPALVVPNVLTPDHCDRLMAYWERGEKLENTVASPTDLANRANPKTKIRSDVIIPDKSPESDELVSVTSRRLLPEVLRAFNFRVSRMEHFRVGCYDSDSGGHFAAHRDNTTAQTMHRRYALTLNLNTGAYEGGFLRLPEYGPQLFAPPAGGAVVFSCSLLHLVTPVTRGRRFALVGFFWGEDEQEVFLRSHPEAVPIAAETA